MKRNYLPFILLIVFFTSCSTAYKTGQTPDDLYYSKGKVVAQDSYVHNDYTTEDRRIRMAAYDWRWRTLDDRYDYNYNYSPYNYGYNYGYYYNPYYYPYPVYSPGIKYINPKNNVIRTTNLNTYSQTATIYTPSKGTATATHTISVRGYNTSNSNNTRSNDNNTRVYTPAANNSSSNNTSTNSNSNTNTSPGTPVTRPARGN